MHKMLGYEGSTTADKMLMLILDLVRRDTASLRTLMNVRKLSLWKQSLISLLAFRVLVPGEYHRFRDAFQKLKDDSVRLGQLSLRLPFANQRCIKQEYVRQLRSLL